MTITQDAIDRRARENAQREAYEQLQAEQHAREAREREARAQIEAAFNAAVGAARAQLAQDPTGARIDEIAPRAAALASELVALIRQRAANTDAALRGAIERGRPLGLAPVEVARIAGAPAPDAVTVGGDDAIAHMARFLVRLFANHADVGNGHGVVDVSGRTITYKLDH